MIIYIFRRAFLGWANVKATFLFLLVLSCICLANDPDHDNHSSSDQNSPSESHQVSNSSNPYDDYDFDDDSSNISKDSSSDDVMVLSESEEVQTEIDEYIDFYEVTVEETNKVEQKIQLQSRTDFQITEPQINSSRGEWKHYTLGSHPETKPEIALDPQPLAEPTMRSEVREQQKISAVIRETNSAISTLKESMNSHDPEKLLKIDDLTIKESTYLNHHLKNAIYQIQQVVYEPDGWVRGGSGKFVGIESSKNVDKINKIINKFEYEVEIWKNDPKSIREDIVHDYNKTSPKYVPSKPYNEKWAKKIKNEPYNNDLKAVCTARNPHQLEHAQNIVKNYERQIPQTKDGSLKAGREHNRFCTINQAYQKSLNAYQQSLAQSNNKESLAESQKSKSTAQDSIATIKSEEELAKDLSIASAIKPFTRSKNFDELTSQSSLSQDFITTTMKELEKFASDAVVFDDVINDPGLGPLVRESLFKEQWILPNDTKEKLSFTEQCDAFLDSWIEGFKHVQNEALSEENVLKKYGTLWCTELDVKTLELAQGVLHPVETLESMLYNIRNTARLMKPLVEFMGEVEFGRENGNIDIERARQKYDEFSKNVAAIHTQFKQLPTEEKFKVATGLIYDLTITPKLLDKTCTLAKSLKGAAKEVISSKNIQKFATAPEKLKKLKQFSEVCEKRAQQLDDAAKTANAGAKYTQLIAVQITKQIEELTSIEQAILELRSIFDQTRNGFAELANKYVKIPYKHILSLEIKITKNGLELSGFHHDYLKVLEKSGLVKITNKVMSKNGFYKADVWFNGKLYRDKTFFPAHWPREKVISTIMEAYDNFKASGAKNFETKANKYTCYGVAKNGIEIKMHITKNGQITSSYPKLKV